MDVRRGRGEKGGWVEGGGRVGGGGRGGRKEMTAYITLHVFHKDSRV